MDSAPEPLRIRDAGDGTRLMVVASGEYSFIPTETIANVMSYHLIDVREARDAKGDPISLDTSMDRFQEIGLSIVLDGVDYVLDFASRKTAKLGPIALETDEGLGPRLIQEDDGSLSFAGDLEAAPVVEFGMDAELGQPGVTIRDSVYPFEPRESLTSWSFRTGVPVKAVFMSPHGSEGALTTELTSIATSGLALAVNNVVYRIVSNFDGPLPNPSSSAARSPLPPPSSDASSAPDRVGPLPSLTLSPTSATRGKRLPLRKLEAHVHARTLRSKRKLLRSAWSTSAVFARLLPSKSMLLVYPDQGSLFAKVTLRMFEIVVYTPEEYASNVSSEEESSPSLDLSKNDVHRAAVICKAVESGPPLVPVLVLILASEHQRDTWVTQIRLTQSEKGTELRTPESASAAAAVLQGGSSGLRSCSICSTTRGTITRPDCGHEWFVCSGCLRLPQVSCAVCEAARRAAVRLLPRTCHACGSSPSLLHDMECGHGRLCRACRDTKQLTCGTCVKERKERISGLDRVCHVCSESPSRLELLPCEHGYTCKSCAALPQAGCVVCIREQKAVSKSAPKICQVCRSKPRRLRYLVCGHGAFCLGCDVIPQVNCIVCGGVRTQAEPVRA